MGSRSREVASAWAQGPTADLPQRGAVPSVDSGGLGADCRFNGIGGGGRELRHAQLHPVTVIQHWAVGAGEFAHPVLARHQQALGAPAVEGGDRHRQRSGGLGGGKPRGAGHGWLLGRRLAASVITSSSTALEPSSRARAIAALRATEGRSRSWALS